MCRLQSERLLSLRCRCGYRNIRQLTRNRGSRWGKKKQKRGKRKKKKKLSCAQTRRRTLRHPSTSLSISETTFLMAHTFSIFFFLSEDSLQSSPLYYKVLSFLKILFISTPHTYTRTHTCQIHEKEDLKRREPSITKKRRKKKSHSPEKQRLSLLNQV